MLLQAAATALPLLQNAALMVVTLATFIRSTIAQRVAQRALLAAMCQLAQRGVLAAWVKTRLGSERLDEHFVHQVCVEVSEVQQACSTVYQGLPGVQ